MQAAFPPAPLDNAVHFINRGAYGDPVADRCGKERSQVKCQPVIIDADHYIIVPLQPESAVPQVLKHAVGVYYGRGRSRSPCGAGTGLAIDLMNDNPGRRHSAPGGRQYADVMAARDEYGRQME